MDGKCSCRFLHFGFLLGNPALSALPLYRVSDVSFPATMYCLFITWEARHMRTCVKVAMVSYTGVVTLLRIW